MNKNYNAHLTFAKSRDEAREILSKIGSGKAGIDVMAPKMRHLCVKLEDVAAKDALFLKETFLSFSGEAALSKDVYEKKDVPTKMVLMGTAHQFNKLTDKLKDGPDNLAGLGKELDGLIIAADKDRYAVPTKKGDIVLGDRPLLMGILNCTPDSFYDGGKFFDNEAAVRQGLKLIEDGADILDIGGESTRPGAGAVTAEEEIKRTVPVIEKLARQGVPISIDTQKADVARAAVKAGAVIINDVSALSDPDMAKTAAQTGSALVLMHMLGTPTTMQKAPRYDDLFAEIISYLRKSIEKAELAGVAPDKIIVDPGIGFGKTLNHNLELIRDLWKLKSLGKPVLFAHSNKSYIGKVLGDDKKDRFAGTAASLVAAVTSGAHIVRVHDVKGMREFADMARAILKGVEE